MSGDDDSVTVTCNWFVKDAVKSESFPAKALKKSEDVPTRDFLDRMRSMSLAELQRAFSDLVAGKSGPNENGEKMALAVGDTVTLKSGGPLMTTVCIDNSRSIQMLGPDVTT
jgi:uncharacterized protein YodC (DUF2158 family)